MFLDELQTDAAVLPRIVALGDIDEDELAFAEQAEAYGAAAPLDIAPKARRARPQADAGETGRGLGETSGVGAAGGRRPGLDAGIGRRSGAADRRHGDAQRRWDALEAWCRISSTNIGSIVAVPADRAQGMARPSRRDREDRAGGAARSADRGGGGAADRASRWASDRGRVDRLDAGNREIPPCGCRAAAWRGGAAGARYRSRRRGLAIIGGIKDAQGKFTTPPHRTIRNSQCTLCCVGSASSAPTSRSSAADGARARRAGLRGDAAVERHRAMASAAAPSPDRGRISAA